MLNPNAKIAIFFMFYEMFMFLKARIHNTTTQHILTDFENTWHHTFSFVVRYREKLDISD